MCWVAQRADLGPPSKLHTKCVSVLHSGQHLVTTIFTTIFSLYTDTIKFNFVFLYKEAKKKNVSVQLETGLN